MITFASGQYLIKQWPQKTIHPIFLLIYKTSRSGFSADVAYSLKSNYKALPDLASDAVSGPTPQSIFPSWSATPA